VRGREGGCGFHSCDTGGSLTLRSAISARRASTSMPLVDRPARLSMSAPADVAAQGGTGPPAWGSQGARAWGTRGVGGGQSAQAGQGRAQGHLGTPCPWHTAGTAPRALSSLPAVHHNPAGTNPKQWKWGQKRPHGTTQAPRQEEKRVSLPALLGCQRAFLRICESNREGPDVPCARGPTHWLGCAPGPS